MCVPLNDEKCMTRPMLADLNPVEYNYYPFTISVEKFNGVLIFLMTYDKRCKCESI